MSSATEMKESTATAPCPTTRTAAAAVTGAAHVRGGRNGQDAVARWSEGSLGVVVVCDGCGSGARSEVGAVLVAQALCAAMARRLREGAAADEPLVWEAARREVVAGMRRLVDSWAHGDQGPSGGERGGERRDEASAPLAPIELRTWITAERIALIEQHLLCTAIAAARSPRAAAVWAIGDGAFVLGGELTVLGPFADNAPPYLGYDLLGAPPRAHFARCDAEVAEVAEVAKVAKVAGVALVATDGAAELGQALCELAATPRFVQHPDALRRHLATLARPGERIVWAERRIERTAAALQDDAAVALLVWEGAP